MLRIFLVLVVHLTVVPTYAAEECSITTVASTNDSYILDKGDVVVVRKDDGRVLYYSCARPYPYEVAEGTELIEMAKGGCVSESMTDHSFYVYCK